MNVAGTPLCLQLAAKVSGTEPKVEQQSTIYVHISLLEQTPSHCCCQTYTKQCNVISHLINQMLWCGIAALTANH